MKSILIQLDEPLFQSLERIAPAASRKRADFIRSAIRAALKAAEEERTRLAYLAMPDDESEADDWSSAEPWEAS